MTEKRWVCWPDPDKVCLEGGCDYCVPEILTSTTREEHRKMTREQVAAYAEQQGIPLSDYWLDNGMRNRRVS